MPVFLDREKELAALEREYHRDGASLVILYGRQRVGKTTLIAEFIRDKHALFFLASEEPETQNRRQFQERAADFINSEPLRTAAVSSWDAIFRAILDMHHDRKPVIVMDEFQYIGKSNPAFPSIFLRIWEEQLKNRSVMVILCGSLIRMMESQALSYGSPLYGRRTAQIRLRQIPFRSYSQFCPGKSRGELVELYAVTGGIPKYMESFTAPGDIYETIRTRVLDSAGCLYDEPYFLLRHEVPEMGTCFALIRMIAAGKHRLSEIAGALEVKTVSLTRYLEALADLGILERDVPVTENHPEKSRQGLYRITDNYIRFWFSFIYPNRSFLESGHPEVVMEDLRARFVRSHVAFVYESICLERMWDLNASGAWPFRFSRVGRYWDDRTEIDIAALDPEGKNLILGECRFWKEPVGVNVLRNLKEKSRAVSWERLSRKVWYVLFSISGFTEELKQLAEEREDILLSD